MKTNPSSKGSAKGKVVLQGAGRAKAVVPASVLNPSAFRIHRLLVPVDFSEECRKAVQYAAAFAAMAGATIELLHVMAPVFVPGDTYVSALGPDFDEQMRKDLEKKLAGFASEGVPAGIIRSHKLTTGVPWREIVRAAEAEGTDLIVISTHGYTGLRHVLMGSVAERVVRHAPCPVLVVRENEREFV